MPQHSCWFCILLLLIVGTWPPVARAQAQAGANAELLKAASTGDLDEMQKALAAGADPNTRDADKNTALILACIGGHEKLARLLLDNHADVNARGDYYATALHRALENRRAGVVRLLIERGADVKAIDGHRAMLVPAAVDTHVVALVQMLLDKGADVEGRNAQAEPALYLAVGNGDIPMVKLLLSRHANPNHGDMWVGSPLSSAIGGNNLELVKLLLDYGANPDFGTSENGTTNIMVAVQSGNAAIVAAMLTRSSNVDQPDRFGNTALMAAAREGNPDAVRLLLAHHADVIKVNADGDTALSLALKGKTTGHVEAARLLRGGLGKLSMDPYHSNMVGANRMTRWSPGFISVPYRVGADPTKVCRWLTYQPVFTGRHVDAPERTCMLIPTAFCGWNMNQESPVVSRPCHLIYWFASQKGASVPIEHTFTSSPHQQAILVVSFAE